MISYILMKAFESAPQRYDWGLKLISLGRIDKIRKQILDNFIVPGDKVLDIGCSTGFFTEYALQHGAEVTAVDISRKSIDILTSRLNSPNLTVHRADISQPMPFLESQAYDIVIASLVLHYIRDWEPLLLELHRVLKSGREVVISTHHPFDMFLRLKPDRYNEFKLVEDTWGNQGNQFKVHFYMRSITEIIQPLLRSKFKIAGIDEMLPDESLKDSHPKLYKRLIERPGFLCIVLAKER